MKRFLYYDQESINSLLAQIEQGLLLKLGQSEEAAETHSNTLGFQAELSGDFNAKLLGVGATLKGKLQSNDADTEVTEKLIKSVQEKVLHDYAFEHVQKYAEGSGLINNTDPQIGDIILVNEVPTFLDFKYFQALFADNGAVRLGNEQNRKAVDAKIAEIKESVPKGGQMPAVMKQQIANLKKTVDNAEPERKEMIKTFETIRNTLPYDRFVMTKNLLIPLEDKNFRDNPDVVAFKYGGQMSIFGYVTNIVSNEETPVRDNDFAPLYDSINQIMLNMFNNQQKIYIVHPVALFY